MTVEFGYQENLLIEKISALNNKLRKITLGTDIDNTEVATSANGILIVNRMFGTNFKLSDLTYDFAIIDLIKKHLPEIDDPRKVATDIWNGEENIRDAQPVPGALIVSKYLNDNGVNHIYRISSRPGNLHDKSLLWYKEKMPWVDQNLIHIQPDGNEINQRFKVEQINKYGINLFFEDSIEHAEIISDKTEATVVLIPQNSNSNYISKIRNRIIRVPDHCYTGQPAFVRAYLYLADVFV